jgi:hypothetical protein
LVGAGIPGLILAMLSGLPSYVGPALLGPLFVVPAIALARFSGHFIYANLVDLQRAFGIEPRPIRRVRKRAPSRPRVQSLPSWDQEATPRLRGTSPAHRKIATPGPKKPRVAASQPASAAPRQAQRRKQPRTRARRPAKNAVQKQEKGLLGNHKHTPLR